MSMPVRVRYLLLAGFLVLYFAQVAGRIYTRIPWVDEGFFGDPATTLLRHGYLGTLGADPNHVWKSGDEAQQIERYFYYLPPLYPVTLAAWWAVVGYGLFAMRWMSAAFGLLLLGSTYSLARSLTGDPVIPLLSAGLLVVDYHFITAAADGRMDCMGAALGFSGLALFLLLTERRYNRSAVVASHTLVALSILTHPNDLVFLPLLVFLMFKDRALSWRTCLWSALPYILALGFYGIYIAQAPAIFRSQFEANLASRLYSAKSMGSLIVHELDRYYLFTDTLLLSDRVKTVLTLPLLAAAITLTALPEFRKRYSRLLIMVGISFLFFTFFVGRKWSGYLVDLLPLYLIAFAIAIVAVIPKITRPVAFWYVLGSLFFTGHAIYLRRYQQEFVPVLAYLKAHPPANGQLNAPPYFGFYFGFDHVHDDPGLGMRAVPLPDTIAYDDEWYRIEIREADAPVERHVDETLAVASLTFNHGIYHVYTCAAPCQALIATQKTRP